MDVEKIEEDYRKERERIDKEFLTSLSKGGDSTALEEQYRKQSLQARELYYAAMNKIIDTQKKSVHQKKPKKTKQEKQKFLDTSHHNFDIGFKQRLKLRWSLRYFTFTFTVRNYIRDTMPSFLRYFLTKQKIRFRHMVRSIKDTREDISQGIRNYLSSVWDKTKELSGKVYKKLVELPPKIIEFLKKKFHKKKEGDSSADSKEKGKEEKEDNTEKKEE